MSDSHIALDKENAVLTHRGEPVLYNFRDLSRVSTSM